MPKSWICRVAFVSLAGVAALGATLPARAQATPAAYPAEAPLDQYLIADKGSEIELARSAAPTSISGGAEVLVMGREGYTTAVKGDNGFTCLVERGFAAATEDAVFWNPKIRGPICVNAAAAKTYLPTILMRARLALAGKSRAEIGQAVQSALAGGKLPPLAPGAMSYMMSKQQYLNDDAIHWHPHMMWFVPGGDAEKVWGGNLPGSPTLATSDPEGGMTIFMIVVDHWSDGTPAAHETH